MKNESERIAELGLALQRALALLELDYRDESVSAQQLYESQRVRAALIADLRKALEGK